MQTEILKLLQKEKYLTGTEIITRLRNNGETKEWIRKSLKKLRHYREINFILVTFENQTLIAKQCPYLKTKLDNGYKIRRPCYIYFC